MIRKLQLPQDLRELREMLPNSFQYPQNPEWSVQEDERESMEQSLKSLQKSWWLVRFGQLFIPSMRDVITGFVWEEEGKIAGCAILQPRGKSSQWVIGTIATHPEYRRRGIARKLVTASLELFREKQGTSAILSVIDGNTPAFTLYQKMGLETFSGHYDVEFKSDGVYPMPDLPTELEFKTTDLFDWKPRFKLNQRITPQELVKFEPVEESRFRQPFFVRLLVPLLNRADKTKEIFQLIYDKTSGAVIGYLRIQACQAQVGRHSFSFILDPAHRVYAEPLLQYILHTLSAVNPKLVIESGIPQWQTEVYEAAQNLGFTTRLIYHRMGINLSPGSRSEVN